MTHYPLLLASGQSGPSLYFGNASHSTTNTSSFSFSSMDFNVDNPSRLIIVAVHWYKFDTTASINSITVGGVTPTLVTSSLRAVSNSYIYSSIYSVQPSGSSGTIAVQFNKTATYGCSVATWAAYDLSSTTPVNTSAGNPSRTVTTQVGDVVVGAMTAVYDGAAATWSGVNLDYTNESSRMTRTGGSIIAPTAGSLVVDANSTGTDETMCVAVWR